MVNKVKSILLISFIGLFLFFGVVKIETIYADTADVELRLHKVLLNENDTTTVFDNAGLPITPQVGSPLDGAEFTVYDVTALIASGETRDSLIKLFTDKGVTPFIDGVVALGVTGSQGVTGEVDFALSSTSNGKNASYFIIETGKPAVANEISQPILISFPLSNKDGSPMKTLDLYPKNYEYARDPYFYKHGREVSTQKDLGALQGAKFRLYKIDENGKRWYLHEDTGDNDNQWIEDVNSSDVTIITSDSTGKVSTNSHWLNAGIYYFEEVSTVTGYTITDEAMHVKVTVPDENSEPVTITVLSKTTTMDNAVVYNDYVTPPDKPKTPDTGGRLPDTEGFLPSTGEMMKSGLTVLGIALICQVTVLFFKKRTKND
ncbi:MAG: LPXTG cell wall anchor domain-containing protein [Lactobacillales bacterium]|jgi:LPXTG-motif cell wall-anchored protein|nr:LPXTG cell wall anchor domain-containing protein [Lactobacillales bacterium]